MVKMGSVHMMQDARCCVLVRWVHGTTYVLVHCRLYTNCDEEGMEFRGIKKCDSLIWIQLKGLWPLPEINREEL